MFERIEETPNQLGQCTGDVPDGGSFRVLDHGAHVTGWAPGGAPVLFTSTKAVYAPDKGIRGGIPICFPWFADGPDGEHRPAHGPARIARWHLAKAFEAHGVTTLEWHLGRDDVHALPGGDRIPHEFDMTCRQRFATELEVELRVRNTGEESLAYEAALHTYLQVGDVEKVTINGLRGSDYLDKVTGETLTQRGPLELTGETDRVFESTADVTIDDPRLDRRITVAKEGSGTTVVWNPWADKARGIADLGDHEWRRFVCVETANVGRAGIHLASGESHAMRLRLSVAPLAGDDA